MTKKAKQYLIDNLNQDNRYRCAYGKRNEMFILNKEGLYSMDHSVFLSFGNNEVNLDYINNISLDATLFNSKESSISKKLNINKSNLKLAGLDDGKIDKLYELLEDNDIDVDVEDIYGCYVLYNMKQEEVTFWTYLDTSKDHRLYQLFAEDDSELEISGALRDIDGDYIHVNKNLSTDSFNVFMPNGYSLLDKFVCSDHRMTKLYIERYGQ